MRNSILFLTANLFGFLGLSQDLIVTKQNDSINCKITKVKTDNIYFTYKSESEYQSTLLPSDKVVSYKYDYFEDGIPKDSLPGYLDIKRLRIAVTTGYSYDPVKISGGSFSELNDYYQELKSGYHIGSSLTYYLDNHIGLGAKYSLFKSSNSSTQSLFIAEQGSPDQVISDDISISFVGVVLSVRYDSKNKKNVFLMNSSIGYLSYQNKQRFENYNEWKGNTLGLASEFCYDIGLTDNLSLGLQLGLISGKFKKLESTNGGTRQTYEFAKRERPVGAARFDLSLGLRYYL